MKNHPIAANNAQHGNAMIYVLIALALFGLLTMTMTRQNDQADGQDITDEQADFYANELISYIASAQNVIDMMISTGSSINELNFVNPTSAGFNTGSHIHKVFHPQGGGLNYQRTFNSKIQNDGASVWAINKNINVQWTPSTANDVIITAYFLTKDICQNINKRIIGTTDIPITTRPHADYFLETGATNFDTGECATCDGYPNLCVENNTNDNYSFYNIIAAQ